MKIIDLDAEAKRRCMTIEQVDKLYEADLKDGKILGIMNPKKTQLISYESNELEALTAELAAGKISLSNLAEYLRLDVYQVRLIVQHLLKIGRLNGELTYNTFVSRGTSRKETLQKAVAQKREHRLSLNKKHR